jgi:hypothetical protein
VRVSDWIQTRAAEIRLAEKEKKAERDRQIEQTNALKAKVEPFWNELTSVLQDAVKQFNAEFPEAERQIDHFERPSPAGLTIRRSGYPVATIRAQLNGGATSIHYSISRTYKKGMDPVEKQGDLLCGLTNGDIGYTVEGIASHDDVAKLFLEPFFQFT